MAVVTLFSLCFTLTFQATTQNLLTKNGVDLPNLIDYKYADNDERINRHHQAIIPTYKFSCCGNITKWGLDVFNNQSSFALDLQVWRPSPTVDDSTGTGCYSLVGNNRFTSISLSDGVAQVTPSPQDYIQFQPGDVLGFYVENAISGHHGVVLRTSPSFLTNEMVWYASIAPAMATSQNSDCPYSVGSNGVLNISTQAAPVISVSITSVPCTPSPSINTKTGIKSTFTSVHTLSTSYSMAPPPNSSSVIESTLSSNSKNMAVSSQYTNNIIVLSVTPGVSKSIVPKTTVRSPILDNKTTLIVSVVVSSLFLSLIIIVATFAIIILLKKDSEKKNGKRRKQSEPGESLSLQQGISNHVYFESESQLQASEAGIEIVPADNGQSVIYHCIGPSTSAGKTISDSEQPEAHHYFELEALPAHPACQCADTVNQLSLGRTKDEGAGINSGKAVPVYEEITLCSQKFQDPSKGCESESTAVHTETVIHSASENSQYAEAK